MRLRFNLGKKPETEATRKLRETISKVDEVLAHADDPDFMARAQELLPDIHEATDLASSELRRQM